MKQNKKPASKVFNEKGEFLELILMVTEMVLATSPVFLTAWLAVLKLKGVIIMPWLWVFSPLWLCLLFVIMTIAAVTLMLWAFKVIEQIIDKRY